MKEIIEQYLQKIDWELIKKYQYAIYIPVGVLVLIVGYFIYRDFFPSTDNAYVNANIVNIIPKVNGYVTKVYVKNNQFVKKGQPLIQIDVQDYQIALNQAKLDTKLALKAQASAASDIEQAKANVKKAQAYYDFSKQMRDRYNVLYQEKAGSQQAQQKFENDYQQALQSLIQAKTSHEQAQFAFAITTQKLELSQSQLENAQNVFDSTLMKAPITGYVSNLNLQVGQMVGVGQNLFGIIDDSSWWIDGNFRETQVSRIHPNQKVSIQLDMYPHTYQGRVESISYASGSTFSLLPPQNSSGNWVKVAQRFTVRISLENQSQYPLRVGASSTVTVNTL
ncbi:MAG TPA: HlyD family secretion protein [Legionellales bacterium]|nr:HlyD family secretion protein [Legionellales bacterium]